MSGRTALCVVAASVLLCACARDPVVSTSDTVPAGNWKIDRQVDRITGMTISSAILPAPSSHSREAFPKQAVLQLLCFKSEPIVRIAFEVAVGSTKNSDLGYRFDEKPGHEPEARFLNDFKTVVIEDTDDVRTFVDELKTSQSLYVRIRSLNAGRTAAEFKLDSAPAAVEAAYAGCPIKPPEPTKPTKPRRR
jgi:hypothetical protein